MKNMYSTFPFIGFEFFSSQFAAYQWILKNLAIGEKKLIRLHAPSYGKMYNLARTQPGCIRFVSASYGEHLYEVKYLIPLKVPNLSKIQKSLEKVANEPETDGRCNDTSLANEATQTIPKTKNKRQIVPNPIKTLVLDKKPYKETDYYSVLQELHQFGKVLEKN
jgi:hypothetical protein